MRCVPIVDHDGVHDKRQPVVVSEERHHAKNDGAETNVQEHSVSLQHHECLLASTQWDVYRRHFNAEDFVAAEIQTTREKRATQRKKNLFSLL